MPKYTLRVPTTEQYAYIEAEVEGTADEAILAYKELTRLVKGEGGLQAKEWNKVLDRYLAEGTMSPEDSEGMSLVQKWLVHEIDKSISRQNYKNPKGEVHHSMQ